MSRAKVRTKRPDGSGQRYLGELGTVTGLTYSWTVPGGCDQLACNLGIPPVRRTEAMDPGRITEVVLGGSVVWDGILDEPDPAESGWSITAHGSGTLASQFVATYSGKWVSSVPDATINNAINRGMGWDPSTVGKPAGIFLGQSQDSGTEMLDVVLQGLTSQGGLTWQVFRGPGGNELQMFPVGPGPANRLLICTDPAPRTLGGDVNAICVRYQSAPDLGGGFPAKFATVFATDDASIRRHGRMEEPMDLTDAGVMLASDAVTVGNSVLSRYQRAQFAGPFSVFHGQLLTLGGTPVELGAFHYGDPQVCRLLLADQGWGGEVTQQRVSFLTGAYEYSDDDDSATVTPFGTLRQDFAALLAQRAGQAKGRRVIKRRGGGHIWWRLQGSRKWHEGPKAPLRNLGPDPKMHGKPPIGKHLHHRFR